MNDPNIAELKVQILNELSENPLWQFKTEDNYWICPYCGVVGSRFETPDNMLGEVLGHLLKVCPIWQKENRQELTIQKLQSIQKAKKWLQNFGEKKNFTLVDDANRWYCPYCAQRQKVMINFAEPSTAQVCEIIEHIENCPEQKTGKPPLDAEHVDLAVKLRRDKRFLFYSTNDNSWFCPWTLKLTNVKRSETEKITRNQVVQTAVHYLKISENLGENPQPASLEIIEKSLKEEREKELLLKQIKENVFEKETWQVLDAQDSWMCPYCRKAVKGVDVKTALSKKFIAPQQIFNHLTEACIAFQTGKKPVENIDEFKMKTDVIRKTPYHQSLSTFMSLVESETSVQTKQNETITNTEKMVISKRDEYNRKMLEKAKKVQLQMLPELPKIKGLEFGVHFKSCDELSGDFYDFFDVSDHELGIVVGDVSGHGVTAALVMAATKKALKLTGKGKKPKDTMLIVNDEIRSELPLATFVTVFYGVLNLRTFELCYVRAGHNPLYIHNNKRKPQLNEYMAKGMIIGTAPSRTLENVLEEETIQLYRGDLIVQYTDGVVEAMNPKREEYGTERFCEFIKQNSELAASDFVCNLSESVESFYDGAEPNDDVTIIAVKVL